LPAVDPVVPGLAELAVRTEASAARPVVLVDGGSGSGKTTLATALAGRIGAVLVRLDDLYPGWDGLAEGSAAVARDILGQQRYRRWDWAADRAADVVSVDPSSPLVIEGSGSLSRENRALATFAIWIDLEERLRKERALARDGDAYVPYWDRWAAQERDFFLRERPDLLADVRIDGRTLTGT
jgi:predicted kinase